jgi:lipopolysaccharide/colanic/teichoic acid biosynthesis glycosyltransferase
MYIFLGIHPFYTQLRVGKNGKLFRIYKFRTLRNQEEETVFPPRSRNKFLNTLRLSKLDELPQLLNILFGDMSFVGPRPDIDKTTKPPNNPQRKNIHHPPNTN